VSSGVRLNMIVEGQTEETFVRELLQVPLAHRGVYVRVRCVETRRRHGRVYRGGMTRYAKAQGDMRRWLSEDKTACLTTMLDLYKLPADFPGFEHAKSFSDPYQKISYLESSLAADIADPRFIPYIQLHEFEGLLFSDVQAIDTILKVHHSRSQLTSLQRIRAQFKTPEAIDDSETTAPSRRLQRLYTGYDKVLFGLRIAQRIGLETLRQECPHFHDWVSKLEALSAAR
jgi:Domain of unknown function (DUF4276)